MSLKTPKNTQPKRMDLTTLEKSICLLVVSLFMLSGIILFAFPQLFKWVFGGFVVLALALNAFEKRATKQTCGSDGGAMNCGSSTGPDSCGGGGE